MRRSYYNFNKDTGKRLLKINSTQYHWQVLRKEHGDYKGTLTIWKDEKVIIEKEIEGMVRPSQVFEEINKL